MLLPDCCCSPPLLRLLTPQLSNRTLACPQVPDPQRLVPPIGRSTSTASAAAAASEPGWTCPACRRTNAAGRAECTHCRTPHPDRALGPAKVR